MARTVQEIMNRELFSLLPDDTTDEAREYILALDITAAPVIDRNGATCGVVSLRDIVARKAPVTVEQCMTSPALTIGEKAHLEEAGRVMAEHFVHHLVVVDGAARARGMVSTLDVIRGLLGMPPSHPDQFPHYDRSSGVAWTNDTILSPDNALRAPSGLGVFALVSGGKDRSERVVWGEAAGDVRSRLLELCDASGDEDSVLFQLLDRSTDLRFRAASVSTAEQARRVAQALMAEARRAFLPLSLRDSS